jgi:chromosome segregation protein
MKLKKVEILGFKSFADKTVVEFHEGITCIVGPNGCGKSNIADAIRWVLGEQSAKAIRGGKMPDVIFGGTEMRKPLNFAEATITFSDVQGALPIDYEEVAITRRIYRSGESIYLINREEVRLKDVHSLFLDSGVGKNNFSFFEQGKIDQIIQYSPQERRYIFEEAAGITRFLQRKRETFRKLEEVSLNLSRANDIHTEVEKQAEELKKQAEEAQIYKQKLKMLAELEQGVLFHRYSAMAKKQKDLASKEGEAKRRLTDVTITKEELAALWKKEKDGFDQDEALYFQTKDALLKKEGEKERKLQSYEFSLEKKKDLEHKREKEGKEISLLEGEMKAWDLEISRLRVLKEDSGLKLEKEQEVLKALDKAFQALEKELQRARVKQTESHKLRLSALQKESSHEHAAKQFAFRLESHLEKKSHLTERIKNLQSLIGEKGEEVARDRGRYQEASNQVQEAKERLQVLEEALKKVNEDVDAAKAHLDGAVKEGHELAAKLKALLHLRKEFSGFTSGGKKLLLAASDPKNPLYGMIKALYEYVAPVSGYEPAVSTMLKGYSQTLVVEAEDDLHRVLKHAKEDQIHDFSVICLEWVSSKRQSLWACHDSPIASHLLQGFALDQEFQNRGKAAWVPSGYFFDAKGVLFVSGSEEHSVFSREAEIKTLEAEVDLNGQNKEGLERKVSKHMQDKKDLLEQRSNADTLFRKLEMKALEANFNLQKALQEEGRMQKEVVQVDEEVKSLEKTMESCIDQKKKAEEEYALAKSIVDDQQSAHELLETHLKEQNEQWTLQKGTIREKNERVASMESQWRKTAYSLKLLEVKYEETGRHLERLKKEHAAYRLSHEELSKNSQTTLAEREQLEKEYEELKGMVQKQFLALEGSREKIRGFEGKLKEIDQKERELEGLLQQCGIQAAHVETGLSSIAVEVKERFSLSIEELQSLPQLEAPGNAEKEIKQIKTFIESCGGVNLAAIEDCKKSEERAKFLKEQMEDLRKGKAELLSLIHELDKESRQAFKTTFELIRTHFQKNFQILFKGGEADLECTESQDVLEAGIEITAKPPGKQMRSLSLLSGGEKCLTAMALLFAIFEVKASPFCILDEIDAPLDDSNVERFLNVVKEFVDRCQFVIITHNKKTMSLADRLYGVSMEEKGVSKLLFVEFAKENSEKMVCSLS